jgi:hypothetical protein
VTSAFPSGEGSRSEPPAGFGSVSGLVAGAETPVAESGRSVPAGEADAADGESRPTTVLRVPSPAEAVPLAEDDMPSRPSVANTVAARTAK